MPARRIASVTAFAPSSVAETGESPPMNLPIGVRTALNMTGCCMSCLLAKFFSSTIGAAKRASNQRNRRQGGKEVQKHHLLGGTLGSAVRPIAAPFGKKTYHRDHREDRSPLRILRGLFVFSRLQFSVRSVVTRVQALRNNNSQIRGHWGLRVHADFLLSITTNTGANSLR